MFCREREREKLKGGYSKMHDHLTWRYIFKIIVFDIVWTFGQWLGKVNEYKEQDYLVIFIDDNFSTGIYKRDILRFYQKKFTWQKMLKTFTSKRPFDIGPSI